jgi:hypothetical protein
MSCPRGESIVTAHTAAGWSSDVSPNDERERTFVRVAEQSRGERRRGEQSDDPLDVMTLGTYTTPARLREAGTLLDTLEPVPDTARSEHS